MVIRGKHHGDEGCWDTDTDADWEQGQQNGSGIWSEPSGQLNTADILRSLFICLACTSIARN